MGSLILTTVFIQNSLLNLPTHGHTHGMQSLLSETYVITQDKTPTWKSGSVIDPRVSCIQFSTTKMDPRSVKLPHLHFSISGWFFLKICLNEFCDELILFSHVRPSDPSHRALPSFLVDLLQAVAGETSRVPWEILLTLLLLLKRALGYLEKWFYIVITMVYEYVLGKSYANKKNPPEY